MYVRDGMYEIKKWFNCPTDQPQILDGSIVLLPGSIIRKDPGEKIFIGPGCTLQEGALLHAHGGEAGGIFLGPANNLGHYAVVHGHVVTEYDVFFGVRSTVHNIKTGHHVYIGHESKVINSDLGSNIEFQECAKIKNSIIGNNVRIGDNCVIKNAVIEDNVVIEAGARIYGSHEKRITIGSHTKLCRACEVYTDLKPHSYVGVRKVVVTPEEVEQIDTVNLNPVTDFGEHVWEHNMELAHISPEVVEELKKQYFSHCE